MTRIALATFYNLRTLTAVLLLGALVMTGCEDDPILEAPSGGTKTGGSYGRLTMDSARKAPLRSVQLGEQNKNPKTF